MVNVLCRGLSIQAFSGYMVSGTRENPPPEASFRRGSRILKWGVNFRNNAIEPINIRGIRRKEGERENKQLAVTNITIRFPRMVYLT